MIMKTRIVGLFTALAIAATAARTASADSPWGIAVYGGDSINQAGSLRSPRTLTTPDLGTLDPNLSGATGTLSLDKLKYDDLFHRTFDTGMELNYSFSDNLQTFGRFNYESLDGRERRAGALSTDALANREPLVARFADQDNKGLELGTRYFWTTGTAWEPFAGVSLGATRLDAIRANFSVPDTLIDVHNVRFTRPSTVFSQSLETGVEYNPNSSIAVRFSVGADHMGEPSSAHDPALSELGFDSAHDANDRWTFPVAIAAAYHFG
jgi:hypothetical protein